MAYRGREKDILEHLKKNKKATVEELAHLLYVSSASIRRDLTAMQREGLVKRTHGGVIYNENLDEIPVDIRRNNNTQSKRQTVNIALKHIPEFETVFIDDSSTCLMLAEKLDLSGKTVITNGLQLALHLSKRDNVTIALPGGIIANSTDSLSGSATIEGIRQFKPDLMLSSCAAIDDENTFEHSSDTAMIKRTAAERCKKRILLIDSEKSRMTAPYVATNLNLYDLIITDSSEIKKGDIRVRNS